MSSLHAFNLLECLKDWTLNNWGKIQYNQCYIFWFKKAFDTVCQVKVAKLSSCGICGNAVVWTEAFFCGHSQSGCYVQAISTPKFVIDGGVPQWSVLGPTLFHRLICVVVIICWWLQIVYQLKRVKKDRIALYGKPTSETSPDVWAHTVLVCCVLPVTRVDASERDLPHSQTSWYSGGMKLGWVDVGGYDWLHIKMVCPPIQVLIGPDVENGYFRLDILGLQTLKMICAECRRIRLRQLVLNCCCRPIVANLPHQNGSGMWTMRNSVLEELRVKLFMLF